MKGLDFNGIDLSKSAGNILTGLDNKLNGVSFPTPVGTSPNPVNYYTPSQASYNGEVAKDSIFPLIAIAGVGVIILVMVFRKK